MLKIMAAILFLGINPVSSTQLEILQKYIDIQHNRIGFNGTVLITKNNRPLYHIMVGKASHELDVPIRPGAKFRVASISKQFTAMLIVLATQEGKLKLDDSLANFFPGLNNSSWKKINLHQLLSHTSGIPHNEGITEYWTLKSRLPLSKDQALAEILAMTLLFEPGTNMKYSSPGYFLLACILESVYKQPYAVILKEKILSPLQMKHTGVYVTGQLIPGLVSGYHLVKDSIIMAPYRDISLMKGAGDLYTSAEDLTTWNNSFASHFVWNNALQKNIFTAYTGKTPDYGYGWYIRAEKRMAYFHGGGTFSCSAFTAWYPHEKVSVVIISNISVLPVTELWNDIEKIIFNEPFELPAINQPFKLSIQKLQTFSGQYEQGQQTLNIFLAGDQLYAKLGINPPFEIYPENEYRFFGKKVNARLVFNADEAGIIASLDVEVRKTIYHFNKKP
jgi:CubicO group peptidase (beta-lactamase class C family)